MDDRKGGKRSFSEKKENRNTSAQDIVVACVRCREGLSAEIEILRKDVGHHWCHTPSQTIHPSTPMVGGTRKQQQSPWLSCETDSRAFRLSSCYRANHNNRREQSSIDQPCRDFT